MGGVGSFFIGMLAGALAVVVFIALNASRPERVLATFIGLFQLMRAHFGRNSIVAGLTNERGWRIEVQCFGCGKVTALKPDAVAYVCDHCNRPFRATGMEAGGAGVNVASVETRRK